MSFVSTGLNYTKEEIEINGNQVPLGKLHDEVCDYMESEWKVSESEILNISTAIWKALEVLNNELIKKDERIKELKEFWKPIIDKFETKFPNTGNANTIALTSLTEAFDIYCVNESLKAQLKEKDERIKELENDCIKTGENLRISNESNKSLNELLDEAVKDIEKLDSALGQFFEAYDHQAIRTCQKNSARTVNDIRSKYGLDKQESKG